MVDAAPRFTSRARLCVAGAIAAVALIVCVVPSIRAVGRIRGIDDRIRARQERLRPIRGRITAVHVDEPYAKPYLVVELDCEVTPPGVDHAVAITQVSFGHVSISHTGERPASLPRTDGPCDLFYDPTDPTYVSWDASPVPSVGYLVVAMASLGVVLLVGAAVLAWTALRPRVRSS